MKVILASSSPRRRELLAQMGIEFEIRPSNKEEVITKEDPREVVMELSEQKADDIAQDVKEDALIIGADTLVFYQGKILGKPKDEEDAFFMLSMLSGKAHQVFTGVTFIKKQRKITKKLRFFEKAEVFMYPLEEKEIRRYIRTKEPLDKAGAYGIQGKGSVFIEKIEGEYYTIVGFPIARIYQEGKGFCKEIWSESGWGGTDGERF